MRQRLKVFEGARPAVLLDPAQLWPSKWTNRHESACASPAFERFKDNIDLADGNGQPIIVRRVDSGNVIRCGSRAVGDWRRDGEGRAVVTLTADVSDDAAMVRVVAGIRTRRAEDWKHGLQTSAGRARGRRRVRAFVGLPDILRCGPQRPMASRGLRCGFQFLRAVRLDAIAA